MSTHSTPTPNTLTVAYLRRSSAKQTDSIERQRELVRDYAARHKLTIDLELKDTKPGDEIDRREGLQELLRLVRARQVGVVIVDEWSRLGRGDPDDVAADIIRPLKKNKVQLHTAKDGVRDLHGMVGRLLNTISASQASEETINLSRRLVSGMVLHALNRLRMGGTRPYGYSIRREIRVIPGRGERLVPVGLDLDPDRAHWVRHAFRRYANDEEVSLCSLAMELNDLKAPPMRGDHWSPSGLRYLLGNPVYLGTLAYGRCATGKYHNVGKGNEKVIAVDPDDAGKRRGRPESEWIVTPSWHDPLVDLDTWERAQKRLESNRTVGRVGKHGPALFSGKVYCKACGRKMPASMVRGQRVYRCNPYCRRTGVKICEWRSIKESELLEQFCDSLSRLATDDALLASTMAHLRERIAEQRKPTAAREAQARRDSLRERIERSKDNLTVLPKERVPDHLQRLEALEQELASLPADTPEHEEPATLVPADWTVKVRALLQSADGLATWLRTLPPGRQRDVIQDAVIRGEVEFRREEESGFLVADRGVFLINPACLGIELDCEDVAQCGDQYRSS